MKFSFWAQKNKRKEKIQLNGDDGNKNKKSEKKRFYRVPKANAKFYEFSRAFRKGQNIKKICGHFQH